MGLKTTLFETIRGLNGSLFGVNDFEIMCKRNGRRISNGERRMRELVSAPGSNIKVLKNKKNYILGYYWQHTQYSSQTKMAGMKL